MRHLHVKSNFFHSNQLYYAAHPRKAQINALVFSCLSSQNRKKEEISEPFRGLSAVTSWLA